MNNQEAFDKNWQHFVVEKKPPGISESGSCLYLTRDGHRCGVGILLTQQEAEVLRGSYIGVFTLFERDQVPASLMGMDQQFLESLQTAHDTATRSINGSFHDAYEIRLRSMAEKYNLKVPA